MPDGRLKEVLERLLTAPANRGARRAVTDNKTRTSSLESIVSGRIRTVCLLTRDKMKSLRKHPAGDACVVDKDIPCSIIRRNGKNVRRRVRRKRSTLLKHFQGILKSLEREKLPQ